MFPQIDLINSGACLVLMIYCHPVAMLMGHRGKWTARLSLVSVLVALCLQVIEPWATWQWLPQVTWPSVLLNVASALLVTVWWPEVWLMVRAKFGPTAEIAGPLRRVSDLRQLASDTLGKVNGGKSHEA